MKHEMIRITLKFVKHEEMKEILIEDHATLRELMHEVKKLCGEQFSYQYIIERSTGIFLDQDISLSAMGIRNGMILVVL